MKRIAFFLIILLPFLAFSQNEAAIWYFGQNAGLDFNSGVPAVLTDGQLNTFEGCASISNSTGNLLFYTDGVTVFNKSHNVMQNGNGLSGNSSSTQSAIIIPKPNNINLYYIFTVDQNVNGTSSGKGINYSIVDMTLNGGLGAITTKNVNILPWAFEKITATKHANNNSIWLITFRTNQFYAWEIDATGINSPITSNVGINTNSSIGYLKASPNSSKIACANYGIVPSIMLYDFNNSNGIVSNETTLILDENDDVPYGVEFSPSSNMLYVLSDKLTGIGRVLPSKIVQYDMQSANISNSRTLINTSTKYYRGALQLAIDGKIYRAQSLSQGLTQVGSNFLGVINNPNTIGLASNYVEDAINISNGDTNRKAVEGLPPFITSTFVDPDITANDVCFGIATQFNFNSSSPPTTITWNFGDSTSGLDNTSTLENPTHIFTSPGVFTVTATGTIGANPFNLNLDVTIYNLPVVTSPITLTKCDDNLDGLENFNLNDAPTLISSESPLPTFTYFLTETEAISNINPIANPTVFSNSTQATVWARVENATGCFETAQIDLEVISIDIPSSFVLNYYECDNDIDGNDSNGFTTFDFSSATNQVLNALLPETNLAVNYYETIADATAETNAINATNYKNITAITQQIVVRVDKTTNTCFGLGFHITLNVNPAPIFNLPTDTTLCINSNSTIKVENPLDTYNYVWTDETGVNIGFSEEIKISSTGIYTVTATDTNSNNCSTSKSIQVNEVVVQPLLNFDQNNIDVIDNSSNNSITINTNNLPVSSYEFAMDNGEFQINNIFQNVTGGLHSVKIKDIDNCLEASVQVSLISIPNFFTPNNDGANDTWQVTGIENQPNSKIYVFDRFGKLIAILNPLGNGWNGLYKGNPLPSTDYWYKVELEDGRLLLGHFSLIRK